MKKVQYNVSKVANILFYHLFIEPRKCQSVIFKKNPVKQKMIITQIIIGEEPKNWRDSSVIRSLEISKLYYV